MATKTCQMGCGRKVGSGTAAGLDQDATGTLCNAHYTEGGWENEHNDNDHSDPANADYAAKCWICHPELNLASKAKRETAGTSRAGMRLTVPVRANGKTKAEAVKAQLPEGYTATIRTVKGRTTLTAKGAVTIVLHWDAYRGGYSSGTVQATNGAAKRVRNASEALRAAGV